MRVILALLFGLAGGSYGVVKHLEARKVQRESSEAIAEADRSVAKARQQSGDYAEAVISGIQNCGVNGHGYMVAFLFTPEGILVDKLGQCVKAPAKKGLDS
jgi:hypothetical protein